MLVEKQHKFAEPIWKETWGKDRPRPTYHNQIDDVRKEGQIKSNKNIRDYAKNYASECSERRASELEKVEVCSICRPQLTTGVIDL